MDIEAIAVQLVELASTRGQAVLRCDSTTPLDQLRSKVREVAGSQGVRIRTGVVDGVLTVVRADADLWHDPVAEMRRKLEAPSVRNVVA